MLELRNITKDYSVGEEKVHALKGVSLAFRENEFVSILGQSGCGKTTLLNIIGGLDVYTDGDLIINGRSTKDFKAADWDAYRNRRIGFVFQSYNLIPHLTVLGNVELALTLSGVRKSERQKRAAAALARVGLEKEMKKRPNQMSGGQMQRVAIARALVNDPDIILADEPTGALDSATSVQVMDLLKEIAADKLVIMVTHNKPLAEEYSTRIVSMLDGKVLDDTAPVPLADTDAERPDSGDAVGAEAAKTDKQLAKEHKRRQKEITKSNKAAMKRTSMGLFTALAHSARNLITKKGRTLATAVAGSIGIIGVALVLALSNGFNHYIDDMEMQMLASYPVTVSQTAVDVESTMGNATAGAVKREEYPDGNKIIIDTSRVMTYHFNRIDQNYLDYVNAMPEGLCVDITYSHAMTKPLLSANTSDGSVKQVEVKVNSMLGTSSFQPLMRNTDYVLSQYDVLGGKYPSEANEIALIIGRDNAINLTTINDAGLSVPDGAETVTFEDVIGQSIKVVRNNEWFAYDADAKYYKAFNFNGSSPEARKDLYDNENNLELKVVGVMRVKQSAALAMYSSGLAYSPKLDDFLIADALASEVGKAQAENTERCVSDALVIGSTSSSMPCAGLTFSFISTLLKPSMSSMGLVMRPEDIYLMACQAVGASKIPTTINFYPTNFDSKKEMLAYLDAYNVGKDKDDAIFSLDAVAMVTDAVGQMIDIMTYVLVAFAAISLVVSSVMISIITYASVVERTKEIGVLRAVGARKIDIMRLFNAETMIIGFAAGVIGVLFTFILSFPLSSLFISISEGMVTTNLVLMAWWHFVLLIAVSVLLTLVAGMIPAYSASKRDPVTALRSE